MIAGFGITWAHWYDQQMAQQRNPNRVVAIACRNAGQLYACSTTWVDKATGREFCLNLAVSQDGAILLKKKEKC